MEDNDTIEVYQEQVRFIFKKFVFFLNEISFFRLVVHRSNIIHK